MPASDPSFEAAASILDELIEGLRRAIDGATADALNVRPAGDDTNSIAVLATHVMHSTRSWLAVATGAALPKRDRPAEFLATADDATELLGFVDAVAAQCRALLAIDAPFEPATLRATHAQLTSMPERVTGAWALHHAIEHLAQHVAHAQLTRQVLDSRG